MVDKTTCSYRIEQAMRLDILRNIGTSNKNRTFEGIIGAVDIHCKAMKLVSDPVYMRAHAHINISLFLKVFRNSGI